MVIRGDSKGQKAGDDTRDDESGTVRPRRATRRADQGEGAIETGADARRDEHSEKRLSDEAHAETNRDLGAQRNADESASISQSETEPNPRGMTDRSDVETDDGEDPTFVEETENGSHRETHLEEENAHDPRLHPEGDNEPTEIDLSEAAMADEASEATGPHSEQAYPAREGTDPNRHRRTPPSESARVRLPRGTRTTSRLWTMGPTRPPRPHPTTREGWTTVVTMRVNRTRTRANIDGRRTVCSPTDTRWIDIPVSKRARPLPRACTLAVARIDCFDPCRFSSPGICPPHLYMAVRRRSAR